MTETRDDTWRGVGPVDDSAIDTRPCPFCAEDIKRAAVLCRYCGREVQAPNPTQGGAAGPPPGAGYLKYLPLIGGALGALGALSAGGGPVGAFLGAAILAAIGYGVQVGVSRPEVFVNALAKQRPAGVDAPPPQWDPAHGAWLQWDPTQPAWMRWNEDSETWSQLLES